MVARRRVHRIHELRLRRVQRRHRAPRWDRAHLDPRSVVSDLDGRSAPRLPHRRRAGLPRGSAIDRDRERGRKRRRIIARTSEVSAYKFLPPVASPSGTTIAFVAYATGALSSVHLGPHGRIVARAARAECLRSGMGSERSPARLQQRGGPVDGSVRRIAAPATPCAAQTPRIVPPGHPTARESPS